MSRRKPYAVQKPQLAADGTALFWRSLREKEKPFEVQDEAQSEFQTPLSDSEQWLGSSPLSAKAELARAPAVNPNDPEDLRRIDRRSFLAAGGMGMGLTLGLGASALSLSLTGCARRPEEAILPYVKQPEYALPGVSYHYATVVAQRGNPLGLLVESHDGRPTKVEGNPDHPASLGASNASAQAEIWNLYDPDRSRTPLFQGKTSTYAEAEKTLINIAESALATGGARLRILSEYTISPTFARLREAIKKRFPKVQFHTFSSVCDSQVAEGISLALLGSRAPKTKAAIRAVYRYEQAKVIHTLDADVFDTEAGSVRAARGFAMGRKMLSPDEPMNRLYAVEPSLTVTGGASDHRLMWPASRVGDYLISLVKSLAKRGLDVGALSSLVSPSVHPSKAANDGSSFMEKVTEDLISAKGASIVVAGSRQPFWVHALVAAINGALGNVGQTVFYFPVADKDETLDPLSDVMQLCADLQAGKVDTLIVLGGDPVKTAPSDARFGDAMKKAKQSYVVSTYVNDTAREASWHVPLSHSFEAWGDALSFNQTLSVQQPLIAPLHGSKSEIDILSVLAGEPQKKAFEQVQMTVKALIGPASSFEKAWAEGVKKGVFGQLSGAKLSEQSFSGFSTLHVDDIIAEYNKIAKDRSSLPLPSASSLEVSFSPDPRLGDGRHANNPWMLELPCPVSKISWDNAAFISPNTAKELGLQTGDMVNLSKEGMSIDIGVFVLPGQADYTLALTLGWGGQKVGRYGSKHGFSVEPLRTSKAFYFATGVSLKKLSEGEKAGLAATFADLGKASEEGPFFGRTGPVGPFDVNTGLYRFVQSQEHSSMEGRAIAAVATLSEYRSQPNLVQYPSNTLQGGHRPGSPDPKTLPLWKKVDYSKGYKWGMAIDMTACTGCNACVVACQAENNIPAVGKEQVMRGREMSWMRVDRYFVGVNESDPMVVFQPVACVQCEEAPCENVCPVNATEHSPEGLNDMAYNRCIGTRYCANNCPYKVRRFNYLNFHGENGDLPDTERMQKNPNVTIRMRGVMEKCSYCVQRIQEAKFALKRNPSLRIGAILQVACEQACPSNAIAFGDLNDPSSRVSKLSTHDRAYRLLAEIGTSPRTSHLAKIYNPARPDSNPSHGHEPHSDQHGGGSHD